MQNYQAVTGYRAIPKNLTGKVENFGVHFDDCDHAGHDYEAADPSVGIFGDAAWCDDCGAWADSYDQEVDVDEEGYPVIVGDGWLWQSPIYLGDE